MKVFVDTDSDIRLARRLRRDISQRGRELEGVLKQYSSFVKPSFEHYIAPLMAHADIIVPRGGDNEVAISLIVQHVQTQLQLVCTILLLGINAIGYSNYSSTERFQVKAHLGYRSSGSATAKLSTYSTVNPASQGFTHFHS